MPHWMTVASMIFNFLTLGRWGETYCTRVWRNATERNSAFWHRQRQFIDERWERIYEETDHCRQQFLTYGCRPPTSGE